MLWPTFVGFWGTFNMLFFTYIFSCFFSLINGCIRWLMMNHRHRALRACVRVYSSVGCWLDFVSRDSPELTQKKCLHHDSGQYNKSNNTAAQWGG